MPSLDRLSELRPHLSLLRDHFASAHGPFDVQSIALSDGRSAFLISTAGDTMPFALAIDRDQLAWSKPRPVAGILPPAEHLAIAPRPDGGVALFAWVSKLHLVAARMWADDGNPFGDFELFAPDGCDSLAAAYGPGFGWLVVCASSTGTTGQRMREDGVIAWSRQGASIGARGASGPVAIVFDGPGTFMLVQRVEAIGGDRVQALRYDADGEPLWAAPSTIGVVGAAGAHGAARFEARTAGAGEVRVELPRGVAGNAAARAVEIDSSGAVRFVSK